MSKKSRERAREARQSAFPRSIVVGGVIAVVAVAVVAVAVVATKMLTGGSSDAAAGIAVPSPSSEPASTATSAAAPGKKLLFFMNPYGYPCQTQLGILNSVADSLSKVAQVVYVKTTEPADLQTFERYGIRVLPSLVIVDENGRELSRFSPGIQSGEAVLAALTR